MLLTMLGSKLMTHNFYAQSELPCKNIKNVILSYLEKKILITLHDKRSVNLNTTIIL